MRYNACSCPSFMAGFLNSNSKSLTFSRPSSFSHSTSAWSRQHPAILLSLWRQHASHTVAVDIYCYACLLSFSPSLSFLPTSHLSWQGLIQPRLTSVSLCNWGWSWTQIPPSTSKVLGLLLNHPDHFLDLSLTLESVLVSFHPLFLRLPPGHCWELYLAYPTVFTLWLL